MIRISYILVAIILFSCVGKERNTSNESAGKPDNLTTPQSVNPYAVIDISPMDMSYFPVNYSQRKMTHDITTPPVMRVIYSRPHKQGRVIFGDLLKYGEPWRLGANEASEIECFQNVTVQGRKVNPGRYIIYCKPFEDRWTIILNSDTYTWGLKIDSTKDLMKFDIPVKKAPVNFENFTMVFQPINTGAELVMDWDDTEARLPLNF